MKELSFALYTELEHMIKIEAKLFKFILYV